MKNTGADPFLVILILIIIIIIIMFDLHYDFIITLHCFNFFNNITCFNRNSKNRVCNCASCLQNGGVVYGRVYLSV